MCLCRPLCFLHLYISGLLSFSSKMFCLGHSSTCTTLTTSATSCSHVMWSSSFPCDTLSLICYLYKHWAAGEDFREYKFSWWEEMILIFGVFFCFLAPFTRPRNCYVPKKRLDVHITHKTTWMETVYGTKMLSYYSQLKIFQRVTFLGQNQNMSWGKGILEDPRYSYPNKVNAILTHRYIHDVWITLEKPKWRVSYSKDY